MDYIPRRGPWEELPETDMSRSDPRIRYVGPAKAKLLNTNLFLGSTWIEAERFKFERRILNVSDFLKQKTIINANMWTLNNCLPLKHSFSVQQAMKKEWAVLS